VHSRLRSQRHTGRFTIISPNLHIVWRAEICRWAGANLQADQAGWRAGGRQLSLQADGPVWVQFGGLKVRVAREAEIDVIQLSCNLIETLHGPTWAALPWVGALIRRAAWLLYMAAMEAGWLAGRAHGWPIGGPASARQTEGWLRRKQWHWSANLDRRSAGFSRLRNGGPLSLSKGAPVKPPPPLLPPPPTRECGGSKSCRAKQCHFWSFGAIWVAARCY